MTIDDEALDDDGKDLPPSGVRLYELDAWLTQRLGRRPTRGELATLRHRHALRGRRRVLSLRRSGLTDAQIVERLAKDFLTSSDAMMGAAITATVLAAATASVELSLGLSDAWASAPNIIVRGEAFAQRPEPILRVLETYADAKIHGRPLSSEMHFVDPDHLAAINAASPADLRGWGYKLRQRRLQLSDGPSRGVLADLKSAGRQLRLTYPDLDLDRPEPGPPRDLAVVRPRQGGDSAWQAVLDAAAEAEMSAPAYGRRP